MNILLAADGSGYAREAARRLGVWLRPDAPVGVDVVTVRPPGDGGLAPGGPPEWTASPTARPKPLPGLWGREVPTVGRIVPGDPATTLLREATAYDLVVAGTKGRGASPFFELGSVARALLQHAPTSVLLVRRRRPGTPSPLRAGGTKGPRIVVAADGSEPPPPGAGRVMVPFLRRETALHVVTVREPRNGPPPRTAPGSWWNDRVSHAVEENSDGPRPSFEVLRGRPAPRLERYLTEVGADLLVLGTHGTAEPEDRKRLGSTAAELAWSAPCSVLIVRTPREGERPVAGAGRKAERRKRRRPAPRRRAAP